MLALPTWNEILIYLLKAVNPCKPTTLRTLSSFQALRDYAAASAAANIATVDAATSIPPSPGSANGSYHSGQFASPHYYVPYPHAKGQSVRRASSDGYASPESYGADYLDTDASAGPWKGGSTTRSVGGGHHYVPMTRGTYLDKIRKSGGLLLLRSDDSPCVTELSDLSSRPEWKK